MNYNDLQISITKPHGKNEWVLRVADSEGYNTIKALLVAWGTVFDFLGVIDRANGTALREFAEQKVAHTKSELLADVQRLETALESKKAALKAAGGIIDG